MKLLTHTVVIVLVSSVLIGCGSRSTAERRNMAGTRIDNRSHVASDTRTMEERRMASHARSQTPNDVALSSAVKERLAEDRNINPQRIDVAADQGTVYLDGSVDSADDKNRAEQAALQVAGVSTVVNQLQVQPGAMSSREASTRTSDDRRACTLVWKNVAVRNEPAFAPIQLRVYEDIGSPLYHGTRDESMRTRTHEEDLTHAQSGQLEQTRTPEGTSRADMGLAQVGRTGGTMQDSGSAQQKGSFAETDRERLSMSDDRGMRTSDERARLYGEEARLAGRGGLIWSGWMKPGEKLDITSASGPIRYDYRFAADDRFHGNKGAWCNEGHRVAVP